MSVTDQQIPDFDFNAGSAPDPRVVDAMARLGPEADANPHAPHARGRAARAVLEDARERIASRLGVAADEVLFCSGGTEANNLALATGAMLARRRDLAMAFSTIEHPSIDVGARALQADASVDVLEMRFDRGSVRAPDVPVAFATCIYAQGEFGLVLDLGELRRELPEDVVLHSDASQALGRIELEPALTAAPLVTLSPHKAGGPRGIGVLVKRDSVPLAPVLRGGSQELGRRPGTQSPRLASGAAHALELACEEQRDRAASMRASLDALLGALEPLRAGGRMRVVGEDLVSCAGRAFLPNTRTLCFPGVESRVLLPTLDMHGIGVSYGSACSSGASEPSPNLLAIGVPSELASCCLRISVGAGLDGRKVRDAASLFLQVLERFPPKSSASWR